MNEPANKQPALIPWALSFLRPHRTSVALLSVLSLANIGLGVLEPWPLKVVIDYVLQQKPVPDPFGQWLSGIQAAGPLAMLITLVMVGVVLQIGHQVVAAFTTQVQIGTGQRMVYSLRYRLLEHLQSLGLHHHVSTSTGDAVYRVDVDSYAIENIVIGGFFPLATSLTTLLVMFVILLQLDVAVALLSLLVVPFLYASLKYYSATIISKEEHVRGLESKLIERLYETFSAMRLVKSFAREPYEVERYSEAGDRAMQARIGITWQQSMFSAVVTTITILGTAIVLVVGGYHVIQNQMTVGGLLVVIAYLRAVYGPLSEIAHTTGQLQGAVAGARRVRAVFALMPETIDAPDAINATGVKGDVRYENVSFSYPDGTPVLKDISFEAKPGQVTALVGLTGAGKTTLVSLLPRFYDATEGAVTVDGVNVKRYRVRSLRERISIVLQEPVLFSGTVADNLRYGHLEATDEQVEQAARAAHAHDFIMRMPKGYQTPIAEAGGSLSGGERQRLSVARALLNNAPILILDEPTSSLDAISEEIVFSALRRLRAGRTTIVIAHRLSTVRDADQILVLDGGRIAARGKHDELLASSDLYARMCARLSVGKSLDDPEAVDDLIQSTHS